MRFTLIAMAASQSLAMRPELARASVSKTIASIGDIISKITSPQESLVSLKEVSSQVSALIQQGPADDHISDDDKQLLSSVISLIEKTIYSSMDDSHSADVAELDAAIKAAESCNADIAFRQSLEGDLGILHAAVQEKQQELGRLQGVVDDKTAINNTKWEEFDTHMQMISPAPACPDFPARTMPALDVYFEKSEYVTWFSAQQASYTIVRDAFVAADGALDDAIDAYNVQKAVRDVQYCDWKSELEAACASFDTCFREKSEFYTNTLVPRVTSDMKSRIEVKKAGDTVVHQINFLLGAAQQQETPAIDTSRYEIEFPTLPAKGLCDLAPLTADEWVPVVNCGGRYCLRVVTGSSGANDGHLSVSADGTQLFTNEFFNHGAEVTDECYEDPIDALQVQNPGHNAWTGTVEYSTDAGKSYHPMYCTKGCNSVGPTSKIVVDGNSDSGDQAKLHCHHGRSCTLVAGGPNCLRIVTGTSGANDGHLDVTVDGSPLLSGEFFHKGEIAADRCFAAPIHEVAVRNPGTNAWTGSLEVSKDHGVSFHPLTCAEGCNKVAPTDKIVVDGNSDSGDQAGLHCHNGKSCKLEAE